MKKITIILTALIALGFTSCDLETLPHNSIIDEDALQTPTDFKNIEIGLYSPLRGMCSGGFYNLPELQSDEFNAVTGFSNTYGDIHTWQFNAQSSSIESLWSTPQGLIGRCNYVIDYAAKVDTTNADVFDASEQALVTKVVGEAYFLRAYCLSRMVEYFCPAYSSSTAEQANSGLAYNVHYAPTSDNSKYPGRNTLAETYAQIKSDINEAKSRITAAGEISSAYITTDVITALEARVALEMGDYSTAAQKAASLIDSGTYPLVTDAESLEDMWRNDGGTETIWQLPIPSTNELAGQTGERFLPYTEGSSPDYIPTQSFIDLYSANDYRLEVFFRNDEITTTGGVTADIKEFNKFPDTTAVYNALKTEASRFQSEPKVFRIAEMYLIAAEAYAQSGDLDNAAKYLNELEASRIEGYENQTFANVSSLMTELRNERCRELAGEGFRISDLRRWNLGVIRGTPQQLNICSLAGSTSTTSLNRTVSDIRMIYPIPKSETDANPQIVQNPGY
jgi:hypothetical protein